ncbi:AraC family transcriptional regulator [Leptospira ognonensis]|uniref:AraC family transcriptional regulator n=1 Tax=Leptospira ognonensis TaxID=2484945 RepID=A0A4R9K2H5_9LEPT|nr:AraC family transcriptional regulator [Leptospira ognonensis]TGL59381.1 AraC family transcriptional regulator [Leptospira ognonensis]
MQETKVDKKNSNEMQLFDRLVPKESVFEIPLIGVKLFRVESSFKRKPIAYGSEIIIIVNGEKKVFFGDMVFIYNRSRYLVLPVPLPLECEGIRPTDGPLLGLIIKIDPKILGALLTELDLIKNPSDHLYKGIYTAPTNDHINDAVYRLLNVILSPAETMILGPMIVREIIYRILIGENGQILQALVYRNRKFYQIAKVLDKIHHSFHKNLSTKSLAFEAGMSVSQFHSCFKEVTNFTPLQYIKSIRLHKAREIMMLDGISAYKASLKVGYESASQFTREYKRLFGVAPSKDLSIVRD